MAGIEGLIDRIIYFINLADNETVLWKSM